jgi:RimJ/RimL family protein N-acetyltransferase
MGRASSATARLQQPAPSYESEGYVIAGFTAADAPDIPRAFTAVYGRDYLSSVVYNPEAFATLIASGDQISFIARDAGGDVAGHIALAFSAPNRGLVELCQGIVTPDHRKSGIFVRMIDRALDFARDTLGSHAVYGISLTNHIVSQKVVARRGFRDVGMEIDYVPQRMLAQDGAGGPAATLVQYLDYGRHDYAACHLPPSYAVWFTRLLDGAAIGGQRQITLASGLDRRATVCELKDMPRFDMARLLVRRAGFDFWSLVGEQEAAAEAAGRRSFQVLINLGDAEGAAAVELLRGWGYACSGLIPGYLEGSQHAAIMYRNFQAPYFEGIKLHDDGAKRLLANINNDWQRAERLGSELRQVFDAVDLDGAEATPAQAAPALPDAGAPSLDTTRALLGIGGRVTLEGGGMPPVDLGGAATAPWPASARPSLVELEAREADEGIRPPA